MISCDPGIASFEHISRLCQSLTPRQRVTCATRLSGGLSNSNIKIHFESNNEPVVLRIYERDPAACRKELELLFALSRTGPYLPLDIEREIVNLVTRTTAGFASTWA